MNKLLITTLIDDRYRDYAELFIWCCHKSYPDYDIKILRKDKVFPDYPDNGYTTNALRMVVPPEHYEGWDYVFITDIDILILRTEPTLLDIRLADMEKDKTVCYANSIRTKSSIFTNGTESWNGTQCLSGLHFCTQEWFKRVEPYAKYYRDYLKAAEVGRGFDGRMLYYMVDQLSLPISPKHKLIKRHHGIHIGTFRLWDEGLKYINRPGAEPMTAQQARHAAEKRVDSQKVKIWKQYMADPEYAQIVSRMTNPDVICQVKKLEAFCNVKD